MEQLKMAFPAAQPVPGRAVVGVVSSGDLEVLLEPGEAGRIDVSITTSVQGMQAVWQSLLQRLLGTGEWPAARLDVHDAGATPGVVRLRIEQAFDEATAMDDGDAPHGEA